MNNDFGAMRGLVEALDVQVTLTVEDGEMVVYARCIVGENSWVASHTIFGLLVQARPICKPRPPRVTGACLEKSHCCLWHVGDRQLR